MRRKLNVEASLPAKEEQFHNVRSLCRCPSEICPNEELSQKNSSYLNSILYLPEYLSDGDTG